MPAFDFPRNIVSSLVGKKNVYFDNSKDEALSVISAFGNVMETEQEAWDAINRLEALVNAVSAALVEDGPTAMSLVVLWGEKDVRVVNADAIPSTVDPNTRVFWMLEKILKKHPAKAVSLLIEKAEPARMTFFLSHVDKGKAPKGAEIVHTIIPTRSTESNLDAKPNLAVTRMMPDAINELLI